MKTGCTYYLDDVLQWGVQQVEGLGRAEKTFIKIQPSRKIRGMIQWEAELGTNLSLCRPNNTDISEQIVPSLISGHVAPSHFERILKVLTWTRERINTIWVEIRDVQCACAAVKKVNQLEAGYNLAWLLKSSCQVCSWLVLTGSRICTWLACSNQWKHHHFNIFLSFRIKAWRWSRWLDIKNLTRTSLWFRIS